MPQSTGSKPAIVLVQGSFQLQAVYKPLQTALEKRGYNVVYPALPSLAHDSESKFLQCSLADDAIAIRSEIIRLVEYQKKEVVVIMHSYGGLAGSEAIPEILSAAYRQKKGEAGGVVRLYYYAAFILGKKDSVLGRFGESPNNDVKVSTGFCLLPLPLQSLPLSLPPLFPFFSLLLSAKHHSVASHFPLAKKNKHPYK